MPAPGDTLTQTSHLTCSLSGQPLAQDALASIVDVTIEQDLVLPDTFAVRLHDVSDSTGHQQYFPMADGDMFGVGKELQIGLGREASPAPILVGDITAIELEARADG